MTFEEGPPKPPPAKMLFTRADDTRQLRHANIRLGINTIRLARRVSRMLHCAAANTATITGYTGPDVGTVSRHFWYLPSGHTRASGIS